MLGLTVRWSLADAPAGVEAELASYVEETSYAKFTGMKGLRFKTWRMRAGEWFEGCYVFASDQARADFQAEFGDGADKPGSKIVGSAPILIEPCDIVAVAEGWDGFEATPRLTCSAYSAAGAFFASSRPSPTGSSSGTSSSSAAT